MHKLRNGAKLCQLSLMGACVSIGVQASQDTANRRSAYAKLSAVFKRQLYFLDK